jgi:hypothetical protein
MSPTSHSKDPTLGMEEVAQQDHMELVEDELDMQYLTHADNSFGMEHMAHLEIHCILNAWPTCKIHWLWDI